MLLDSNILIYLAQPGGEKLLDKLALSEPAASLISWIETFGFHRITSQEDARLKMLFAWVEVLPVSEAVAGAAVILRKEKPMKLGDAIIAATALEYALPLVTRNEADFKHVTGLQIVNPFANVP